MRAAPAKFLFDHDFAVNGEGMPSTKLAEHANKLKEAEAAGYRRGFADAQAEAQTEAERRAAAALERIAAALEKLDHGLAAVEAKIETEAVAVAVAVAMKLAPELMAREPFAEVSALATNCFRHLVATPHVVVRVHDSLHAAARQQLDDIVRACGLESRLVVLAESDIAPGDCRIEWADGGITRDSAATRQAIEQAVARYMEARLTAPAAPEFPRRNDG
jgi:flagellar assembly protein FliH